MLDKEFQSKSRVTFVSNCEIVKPVILVLDENIIDSVILNVLNNKKNIFNQIIEDDTYAQ